MKVNKIYLFFGTICALIFGLSNSGLHPLSGSGGYTGSPADNGANCANCHTGFNSSLDGDVFIDGLPTTIETGTTYTLTVTVTNPNGNAARGGFQLMAVTGTNANAGTMSNAGPNSSIRMVNNKNYFGHVNAPTFPASNELTFNVDWTAPATTGSIPEIKFYAAAVIGNGANGNGNDRVRLTNQIVPITAGAMPLQASITNVVPTQCFESTNGSATATATGGTSPYSFAWNNGVNGSNNNSLPAGLAEVTVTDNTGATATATATITSPPAVIAVASGSVICNSASNGVASVLASGGVGGFTYSWSTGQNGSNISGLSSGLYTVTVTDANGCQETSTAEVSESPEISVTGNISNVSCFNLSNGSITLDVSGGTPGFLYNWSNGTNQVNASNLVAGNYTVTVTDAASCNKVASFTVTQPTEINITFPTVNNVSCFGGNNGSVQMSINGGTPPYNFTWSNGSSGNGNLNTQNNLLAGIYQVTVTDLLDCNRIQSVEITQPNPISISEEITNISCFGLNDGSILAIVSNVVGNPSYSWSTGGTNAQINNLSPGIYSLTVSDDNACSSSKTFSVIQPSALSLTTLIENASCADAVDGEITVVINGGTTPYTYLWNNGSTTQNQSNVAAGTYFVTVTDDNSCTISTMSIVNQPPKINIETISMTNATCLGASNGAVKIEATNGVSPYSYLWSTGSSGSQLTNVISGDYIVTVTDANNCNVQKSINVGFNSSFAIALIDSTNVLCHGDSTGSASVTNAPTYSYLWSTGHTTSTANNLPAGSHTIIATESGCQSVPLIVTITQPPLMKAMLLSSDTILCPRDTNGFLSVALEGGIGNLTFEWSHRDSFLLTDTLSAGVYTIKLTDENQCQVTQAYTIYQADSIKIDAVSIDSVRCYDESNGGLALNVIGGFGNLEYNWSLPSLLGDTLINLQAGTYRVTILDKGNCAITDSFLVEQPSILKAGENVSDESANGANDGSITITPEGGTAPYRIAWTNGNSTLTIDNLSPGLYNYILTDANDCEFSSWAVVGGGDCGLSASFLTTKASCYNTGDGSITLNIVGNFEAYDILIYSDDNLINRPLNSLFPGTYTVIISDSASCLAILSDIQLTSEFPAIILDSLKIVKPSTLTSKDGSLSASLSGGTEIFTYEWSLNGQIIGSEKDLNNIGAGNYQLKVTDSFGCIYLMDNIIVGSISSLNDNDKLEFKIFPNPIVYELTIQSNTMISKVEFFDILGKELFIIYPNAKEVLLFSDQFRMDEPSIVICRIWSNGDYVNKKIVVVK